MSTQVQWRRGNASEHNAFTGANAEITVDTTNWTLRVHDGTTQGGYQIVSNSATQTLLNKTLNSATIAGNTTISGNLIPSANVTYSLGTPNFRFKDLWLSGSTLYIGSSNISINNNQITLYNESGSSFAVAGSGSFDLSGIDANIGTIRTNLNTLDSNVGAYEIYANTSINNINANIGAFQTYANANIGVIKNDIGSITSTANANTAAYLPSYSGSVGGTITTASQPNITTLDGVTSIGSGFGSVVSQGNLTVVGNLTVQGNTLTVGSTNLAVSDSIIELHSFANLAPLVSDDGRDIGIHLHYYKNSDSLAFFGWENDTETLIYLQKATETSSNVTGTYGNVQFGSLLLSNTTTSTSTTTGSFQVRGGAGISGNVYSDRLYVADGVYWSGNSSAFSSSPGGTTGQLQYNNNSTFAGANISFNNANGNLWITSITPSVSSTTGALVVSGGVGISGVTTAGGNIVAASGTVSTSATTGALVVNGGIGITGNVFTSGWLVPTANTTQNIGSSTNWWGTIFGVSQQAKYADLAENYASDKDYDKGTVVIFGGEAEITISSITHDTRVAGVVSTNPGYLMNASTLGLPIAFTGRVPCKVQGPVEKGTVLVTSNIPGVAEALNSSLFRPGCILGKSLESISDNSIKTIEVVVGRF